MSKLMENHLITKKHKMFTPFVQPHVRSSDILMTFNLTQLLFLAGRDIVYWECRVLQTVLFLLFLHAWNYRKIMYSLPINQRPGKYQSRTLRKLRKYKIIMQLNFYILAKITCFTVWMN